MDKNDILEAAKGVIENAIGNNKKVFFCRSCAHKNVCKKIEENEENCSDFMDDTDYQKYASIYHFFDPIFDWMKFHYPAGDVKFIVDRNSAIMFLEYKPCVFSKEITQFGFDFAIQRKDNGENENKHLGN